MNIEQAQAQAQICTMTPAEAAEVANRAAEICDRVEAEPEPTPPTTYRDIRRSIQTQQATVTAAEKAAEQARREEAAAQAAAERQARFDAAQAGPRPAPTPMGGYKGPSIRKGGRRTTHSGKTGFRRISLTG